MEDLGNGIYLQAPGWEELPLEGAAGRWLHAETRSSCVLDETSRSLFQLMEKPCNSSQLATAAGISTRSAEDFIIFAHAQGLILKEAAFLDVPATTQETAPEKIFLTMPTGDRPEAAARAATQFSANLREHGHSFPLVVIEDSPSEPQSFRYRDLLASQSFPHPCYLFDHAAKKRWIRELGQRIGCQPEILEFALIHPESDGSVYSLGANLNLGMLLSAGGFNLSIDDDIQALGHRATGPKTPPILSFLRKETSFESRYFQDEAAALKCYPASDFDFAGSHLEYLGKKSVGLARSHALDLEKLRTCPARHWHRLFSEKTRVLLTSCGLLGESGFSSPLLWVSLSPQVSEHVLPDEETARRALHWRIHYRGSEHPSLMAPPFFFQSYAFGLDLRELVPPFFPWHRGADGLQATLLALVRKDSCFLRLPWSILHSPWPKRKDYPSLLGFSGWIPSLYDLNHMIHRFLNPLRHPLEGLPPERLLAFFGKELEKASTLEGGEFRKLQQTLALGHFATLLEQFEEPTPSMPESLAKIRRYMHSEIRARAASGNALGPAPYGHETGCDDAALARSLNLFGKLLQVWPAMMREAARMDWLPFVVGLKSRK